jgi:Mg2+ and Co2+ transporter CorA
MDRGNNMKGYVSKELIKAKYDELSADVESVKSDLKALKESVNGNAQADDLQKLNDLKDKLLVFKSGQAVLIDLLN